VIPSLAIEIFNLPFMSCKRVDPVNDALAATVSKAFTRENATPRRRIDKVDGEILSQYARLFPVNRVVVRTANLDMAAWFCAGLDDPPAVYLDDRLPPLLTASGVRFEGNWVSLGTNEDLGTDLREAGTSAILADRADIIEFSDALCADISSSRHQILVLHNVKDIPTQQFVAAVRAVGINIELIPAHVSFAVCDLKENDAGARAKLIEFVAQYTRLLGSAPEHLRPRVQKDGDGHGLIDLFTKLLARSFEAAAAANRLLRAERTLPPFQRADGDFNAQALSLAGALCSLLDPKSNAMGAMVSQEYRDQAQKAYEIIARSPGADPRLIRDQLLDCYEIIWKVLHVITSLTHHSLEKNKTVRLATDKSTKGVIVPRPYKPFDEYIFFYRFQDFYWKKTAKNTAPTQFTRWEIGNQVDHYVRLWQAVALVELLFMVIRRERPNETIRWLDLGCSNGVVTNLVRLEECLPDNNWEIVGVDWNASAIEMASKRAGPQRKFLVGDLKEAIDSVAGNGFNIISAFEVIEHFEDPVTTVGDCASACLDYFIGGSPRSEHQGFLPVANHIWTFDRQGFEDIFRAAGLTPTFANEALVGSYCVGADWLTAICGRNKKFPQVVGSIRKP
jgi:Methyltransferase domain